MQATITLFDLTLGSSIKHVSTPSNVISKSGNLMSLCISCQALDSHSYSVSSSLHRCSFLSLFFFPFSFFSFFFLNIIFRPYFAFPYPLFGFSLLLSSAIAYHFLSSSPFLRSIRSSFILQNNVQTNVNH